jgi:hypothetical protein
MDNHEAVLSQMEVETKPGRQFLPDINIGWLLWTHQSKRVALYPGQPFNSHEPLMALWAAPVHENDAPEPG